MMRDQDARDEHDELVNQINKDLENAETTTGIKTVKVDNKTEQLISCKNCIHNGVCVAYRGAVAIKADFDGKFNFTKLPMFAEALAVNCKQFLRPQA